MELTVGKKTYKELAQWMNISSGSFANNKEKKLEELKYFAEYHMEKNKVVIDKVLNSEYSKLGSENYRKVVNKIDEVWADDGLDSCSRVGQEIYEILVEEDDDFSLQDNTVYNYTRKGRNELYGIPFTDGGKIGNCIYLWCKRDRNTGNYSKLTDEERKIKEKLQTKYFGDATEKQILVKGMIEEGEIEKEEAWDLLEDLTGMTTGKFKGFLDELQDVLGCQIVRGTLVERNAFALEGE